MKIAIATPAGKIGSKVTKMLLDNGSHDLVLLAHHASKVEDARARGAKVHEGELLDWEYVKNATRGVDALFWAVPPNPTTDDANRLYREVAEMAVNAVEENNIKQVVFISSLGGHLGAGVGIVDVFRDTEKILRDGIDNLRILRPTYFMENLMMGMDGIVNDKRVYLPAKGETKLPMIATRDIAKVAADLLIKPFNGTQVIELMGPREYSFDEATKILGDAIGEPLTFTTVPPEAALGAMTGMGMSQHMAGQMVELIQGIDQGRLRPEFPRSEQSTTPTTMEEFAKTVFAPALAGKA